VQSGVEPLHASEFQQRIGGRHSRSSVRNLPCGRSNGAAWINALHAYYDSELFGYGSGAGARPVITLIDCRSASALARNLPIISMGG